MVTIRPASASLPPAAGSIDVLGTRLSSLTRPSRVVTRQTRSLSFAFASAYLQPVIRWQIFAPTVNRWFGGARRAASPRPSRRGVAMLTINLGLVSEVKGHDPS